MPKVTFITPSEQHVVVKDGIGTLMEIAMDNEIEGITANCGGVGSCATCHIKVSEEWMSKMPEADEMEKDTLEFQDNATPCSRLSCQVEMTDELDGLVVTVIPEE